MSVLNAWQKITRVLPSRPFGDGRNGTYTSSTLPTLNVKTCSGTASSSTLTADTDASPFSAGDIVFIHQSRGTGVGQWEINKISSVGSDQYTLSVALHYTFTDSGASQAQVIKIPMYSNINVSSGTWTLTAWNQDIYGILPIACCGTATFGCAITASALGYYGGVAANFADHSPGYQGEGTSGAGTRSTAANGTGGGGGTPGVGAGYGDGGGGGNSNDATAGETFSGSGAVGAAGGSSGSADLTTMVLGAGGGGSGVDNTGPAGSGGKGGAIIAFFTKNFVNTGSGILSNGADGGHPGTNVDGGNGAGGSILIVCQTATLGTITASGADGTGTGSSGGHGASGRIAVHHSSTISGSTTPSYEDVEDTTLYETLGGSFLYNLI